jgi:2Fe-2S ferredoxin
MHVTLIADDGTVHTISAKPGRSLMYAATKAGIDAIAADCGGCLTCATCHVYVDPAWVDRLPAPSGDELGMLEMTAAERRPESRLSCELRMGEALDGLVVRLPATQY